MEQELWIAFVHVKPKSTKSPLSRGARGAYANALGLAKDASEFADKIKKGVSDFELKLIELEDMQTFESCLNTRDVSIELRDAADSVLDQIYFDTFYNYFSDDEVQ
jgi:hypothetical protein